MNPQSSSSSATVDLRRRNREGMHVSEIQRDAAAMIASAWRKDRRLTVEQVLKEHPEFQSQSDAVIALICEEICLRQDRGESIARSEFFDRFPKLHRELQILFDCQELFDDTTYDAAFPIVGEILEDFQLMVELGRGASSRVFLAEQQSLANRYVVVKVVPAQTSEHFCLARLQHTHIVPLYSAHAVSGGAWLALCMPWFGDKTLASIFAATQTIPLDERSGRHILDALDDQPIAVTDLSRSGSARAFLARCSYVTAICWIGVRLAEALQFAHERGVVHLDVKPSNVLLSSDAQPMLLDFHLARPPLMANDEEPAWLGGTRGYMPPEQAMALNEIRNGKRVSTTVDARADIYSLGVLLCQAFGATVHADKNCVVPDSLTRLHPGLSRILSRCLHSSTEARYQSAAALADDLRRHMNDQRLLGVTESLSERWRKWRRRRPLALFQAVAAVLLIGLMALAIFIFLRAIELARI